jgi:2-polyprenyl-6-methoxyphenol hydroxylase-like FAD-dependent oxidoreductase
VRDTQVVVAGAGPVGLMLAGELRLAGVSVVVIERRREPMTESRASQLNTRTAELLHERGLDDLLAEAEHEPMAHFGGLSFDVSTVASDYAGNWKVPQYRTEATLAGWARDLGADIVRAANLTDCSVTADHVVCSTDTPSGTERVRGRYLVGCDGQDSTVRRLGGFGYPEAPATRELLRADLTGVDLPDHHFQRFEHGFAVAATRSGVTRVMVHEFGRTPVRDGAPPDYTELASVWTRVTGEDISGGTAVWLDAFDNSGGQVSGYRRGRLLLAGDAAHRHLPIGGQSLNTGLQDAVNLGWKLGGTVAGWAPPTLLDTYSTERWPVGRRVLDAVAAQELLQFGAVDVEPMRAVLTEVMSLAAARSHFAGLASGLNIRYGDAEHPLIGRRLAAGPEVIEQLIRGRAVLLPDGPLVRPDGYVAWADGSPSSLDSALAEWFGGRSNSPILTIV